MRYRTLNPSPFDAFKPHPSIFHFQSHYQDIHLEDLLARQIHGRCEARNPYNRRTTPFKGTAPLLFGRLFGRFDTGEAELVITGPYA